MIRYYASPAPSSKSFLKYKISFLMTDLSVHLQTTATESIFCPRCFLDLVWAGGSNCYQRVQHAQKSYSSVGPTGD